MSLKLSGVIPTIIPLFNNRFANKLEFKDEKIVNVGESFDSQFTYTLERVETDIFMISRKITEGFNKGKKEFQFGIIGQKNFPILIDTTLIVRWIQDNDSPTHQTSIYEWD